MPETMSTEPMTNMAPWWRIRSICGLTIFIPTRRTAMKIPPHDAQHAKPAKELKRTAHVPEQEADGQEVKKDTEGTTDAIVALAPLAVDVVDGNLGDGSSIPTGEGGNEAVHLAVERNVVDDLAAIGFEGGAKVMNVD